ncbi:MAG: class I SAM-dependent methyltransferase [Hyphomicrobiales bacterium]|nr:class I SAM-dependent methyltransferase [Hyphomicrobiales bacterium]
MTPAAYLEMAETEDQHWWFVSRRAIVTSILDSLKLPQAASILEVGSGTSGNLDMLSRYGRVTAMEMDETARRISVEKTQGRFDIRAGVCPDALPFAQERFDLICMFDVLEHIGPAEETLASLRGLLAPGGRLLVTVPAYQWMWSAHDEFLHHKRRYTAGMLRNQAAAAGLTAERVTYFNTLLFPLAASMRMLDKALGRTTASGNDVPVPLVNRLFRTVFASERHLLKAINLPFGVSLMGVFDADGRQG